METEFLELKSLAVDQEAGTFKGLLAAYSEDQYQDVIEPGAFTKTLQEAKAKATRGGRKYLYPLLFNHNPDEPIGGITEAQETKDGLEVGGQLDLDVQRARECYSLMKKGMLSGLSIRYVAVKKSYKAGARHLHEIKLLEGSVVTFPANEDARVSGVKSADTRSIADRDATWDAGEAQKRVAAWAGYPDHFDPDKFAQAYFYVVKDGSTNLGDYKLPYCDIINGKLTIIPRGVFGCESRFDQTDMPASERPKVRTKIDTVLNLLADHFNDDSLRPDQKQALTLIQERLADLTAELVAIKLRLPEPEHGVTTEPDPLRAGATQPEPKETTQRGIEDDLKSEIMGLRLWLAQHAPV